MGVLIVLAGVCMAVAAYRLRRGRGRRRLAAVLLTVLALAGLGGGGYWSWFTLRPQPASAAEAWFSGIRYERHVMRAPRPIVAHLVHVDLNTPKMRLVLTGPDGAGDRPFRARTASDFAREHKALVAVNASYFFPFRADHPFGYYPHAGDGVQTVGYTAFGGKVTQGQRWTEATLYVDAAGRPSFVPPPGEPFHALSGSDFLVREGRNTDSVDPVLQVYPRTAVGLDREERRLFLLVVEGKQPGYSEGATLTEAAEILLRAGAHTAINLDGGGSSAMVRKTKEGAWRLVNGTSNFGMPWWERPVANHIGVVVGE